MQSARCVENRNTKAGCDAGSIAATKNPKSTKQGRNQCLCRCKQMLSDISRHIVKALAGTRQRHALCVEGAGPTVPTNIKTQFQLGAPTKSHFSWKQTCPWPNLPLRSRRSMARLGPKYAVVGCKVCGCWVHVYGYYWVHVCGFWMHVYGAVGCMPDIT